MLRSTSIRFASAALFPLLCWAQLNRGTLTGVISDPSGAAVSGATITESSRVATNVSTKLVEDLPLQVNEPRFDCARNKNSGRLPYRRWTGGRLGDATFGDIRSQGNSPRRMQVVFKIAF